MEPRRTDQRERLTICLLGWFRLRSNVDEDGTEYEEEEIVEVEDDSKK
jgi:hypothetical protein